MHGIRKLCTAALFAIAGLAVAPAGDAAPKKPVGYAQRMEARRLFDQAHLAYERGRYEEAILKWEKSHALSGEPLIFESIANAYERLGDPKLAREYLAKWRAEAPPNEWPALDDRLASLDSRIEREQEEQRAADEQRHAQDQKRESSDEERERARRERERLHAEQAQLRDRESFEEQLTIAGWTLAGVGAAAVAVGVILDAVATSSRPDEENACAVIDAQQLCREMMRDDIEGANAMALAGDITWISGAAVGVTGVALLVAAFLQTSSGDASGGDSATGAATSRAPGARLLPVAGMDGVGLHVVGLF